MSSPLVLNASGPPHLRRRVAEHDIRDLDDRQETTLEVSAVHQYFSYSLDHPDMFEALVALSLSNLRIHSWEQVHLDKETTYHCGNGRSTL